jgi:hypothetical protein
LLKSPRFEITEISKVLEISKVWRGLERRAIAIPFLPRYPLRKVAEIVRIGVASDRFNYQIASLKFP